MKTSKLSTLITTIALPLAVIMSLIGCSSAKSLLEIGEVPYRAHTDGIVSTFENGVAYRRPGHPIQLSLTGTHYEMGKQYGVLLRPEIQAHIRGDVADQVNVVAEDAGMPKRLLLYLAYNKSKAVYARFPKRFQEHVQGIAEGSGVPLKNLILFTTFGLVSEYEDAPDNCAGVVVRTASGGLFHGWNHDDSHTQSEARNTLIVQYHPTGYHTYTNVNTLLSIDGVAAYNDAGLSLTENTLAGGRYGKGMHSRLLGRVIMEECETLDDVTAVLNTYSPMTATALLISDRNSGNAIVFDIVPSAQPTWGVTHLEQNALWTVNRFSDQRLAKRYENDFLTQESYNAVRLRLFQAFFRNIDSRFYTLDDVIHAMRLRNDVETDTFRAAVADSVCNVGTVKTVIHDAHGKGVYIAKGDGYFGAMAAFYFYPNTITEPPQLYKKAEPLDTELREIGMVVSQIMTSEEWAAQFQALLHRYPDDAFLHAVAARMAFDSKEMKQWQQHSLKAYQLYSHPEYQIDAAAVALYHRDFAGTITLLESMNVQAIDSLHYQARRLALLSKAYLYKGEKTQAEGYWTELEQTLQNQEHIKEIRQEFLPPLEQ